MILAIDVQYRGGKGIAAGILFETWTTVVPVTEFVSEVAIEAHYVSGQFYKRELPCILQLLQEHAVQPAVIVVDGYVFLDGKSKPGLGKYLYDALSEKIAVMGVAKNKFRGIGSECAVWRGKRKNPLYVTAVGMSLAEAKENILMMPGPYRIPTLLKRADQLCREQAGQAS